MTETFVPVFDKATRGRAINIAKGFLPNLEKDFSFDDLLQESWIVFDKCAKHYGGTVTSPQWFRSLFDTALKRKFISLTRKIRDVPAYNVCATSDVGVERWLELAQELGSKGVEDLLQLARDPRDFSLVGDRRRRELRERLILLSKESVMATKAVKKAPAKPAAAKKPAAKPAAKPAVAKKAAPAASKKTVAEKKVAKPKGKVGLEETILSLTKQNPREEGEDEQEYLGRLAEAVSELPDEPKLPNDVKAWYDKAYEASEKEEALPGFGKGKGKKEKEPKAERKIGFMREGSQSHNAVKYLVENPEQSLKEATDGCKKLGVSADRVKMAFAFTHAVLSLVGNA